MVLSTVGKTMRKVFGSRNDRLVKAYRKRVEAINALEPSVRPLSDAELRAKTATFREQIASGKPASEVLPEAFAVAREVMDRSVGIRNILNPELNFDPGVLPERARGLYEEAKSKADALEPVLERGAAEPLPGWRQVELPVELYDAVRQLHPTSRPPYRARPFDVQLIGGMVLFEGRIAEMKTGEGKTIVAPLACYLACLESLQVHVVTVNPYLVQRDRDWVAPFYYHLGLTVGAIHNYFMQPEEKKRESYDCDVVYGTNTEFGFDYLRDNMKLRVEDQLQKRREFVIVDEIDSILIDEARTPLIISGAAHDDAPRYAMADELARHLIEQHKPWAAADRKVTDVKMRIKALEGDIRNTRDKASTPGMRDEIKKLEASLPELEAARDEHRQYYEVELDKKAAHLTHEGVAEAQRKAGIGSFYVGANMDVPHLLENALRAHVVYQRDRDYIVEDDEVIIIDEFTGRKMQGRQWSDGLHQAVEAKEGVKIKQETQTHATVTVQNFVKLYGRVAGMTGTAITEATEFMEVYGIDVVCIPTNVPVVRRDHNDLIFLSAKDKWNAILDEIKRMHDVGRPVLVGTTSVEKSESLSAMLTRRHGIEHSVLNAKQVEREALIVEDAGRLGAVMIATNMAGRGTDIKLQPVDRDELIEHWKRQNLLPHAAKASMSDAELVAAVYRYLYQQVSGLKPREVEELDDAAIRTKLLRHWSVEEGFADPNKVDGWSDAQCMDLLDKVPDFVLHRLEVWPNVEAMGGLHIVGTERHESRRIDNQLRGRAGRQGDRGSSRFFISLEDELMQMFAGQTTMKALSRLGMKEGDAIEHSWITSSVQRAQRKVEERNYQIRKSLLEYDEVMEYQRSSFYGLRQRVLEGRAVDEVVLAYIGDAIDEAVSRYLDKEYVQTEIAEWCRQQLEVSLEPGRLRIDDAEELREQIRRQARSEARQVIDVTLGEYMDHDVPPESWDLKGLSSWAMSRFQVDLKQNQLRQSNPGEVRSLLLERAEELIDRHPLQGVEHFLQPAYAQRQLADWAGAKFGIQLDPDELVKKSEQEVADHVWKTARDAYAQRELRYPITFILDLAFQAQAKDPAWAAAQLAGFAHQRYGLDWTPETVKGKEREQLEREMREAAAAMRDGGLERIVDQLLAETTEPEKLAELAEAKFGSDRVAPTDLADPASRRDVLLKAGRAMLREEVTQVERYVLLQVLDASWKEHLYAMDQIKGSVGLRGYAERDPRIEYKREGAAQFTRMQDQVRDRVTDLIYRMKLTPDTEARSVFGGGEAHQDEAVSLLSRSVAAAGSAEQQRDLQSAQRATGGEGGANLSRRQRRRRAALAGKAGDEPPRGRADDEGDGEEQPTPTASKPRGGGFKQRRKKSR